MKKIFPNNKIEIILCGAILVFSFYLRWQGAVNVPIAPDEPIKFEFAQHINFNPGQFNLPLGDTKTHNGPLLPYLIKAAIMAEGDLLLSARLLSVIFSILTLLFLYLLVKESLDQETALFSLLLLAVSQLHIGFTRIVDENGFLIFFVVMTLFFIQKALRNGQGYFVLLSGLMMGLGGLVKGTMFTMLPGLLLHLLINKKDPYPFSTRKICLFLLVVGLTVFPSVYWDMVHEYTDFNYHADKADFFFFSFIPLALFLGEIIVFCLRNIDDATLMQLVSYEYPFCNWLMGLICLTGATCFINREKNEFINLLRWIFGFIFIFFSLVKARSGGGANFHLDNFWWAIVAVIPGVILGAAWLLDMSRRYTSVKYVIIPAILFYLTVNSLNFVYFPALCAVPRRSLKLFELNRTAQSYMDKNLPDKTLKIQEYIRQHYR